MLSKYVGLNLMLLVAVEGWDSDILLHNTNQPTDSKATKTNCFSSFGDNSPLMLHIHRQESVALLEHTVRVRLN